LSRVAALATAEPPSPTATSVATAITNDFFDFLILDIPAPYIVGGPGN
jgi:hypothetical protein